MNLINLTGVEIKFWYNMTDYMGRSLPKCVELEPAGKAAVVCQEDLGTCIGYHHPGFNDPGSVTFFRAAEVVGLPEPSPGTIYIVPCSIAVCLPDRKDLAVVNQDNRLVVFGHRARTEEDDVRTLSDEILAGRYVPPGV